MLITVEKLKTVDIDAEFAIFEQNRTSENFDIMLERVLKKWTTFATALVNEVEPGLKAKLVIPFEAIARVVNLSSAVKAQAITKQTMYNIPITANIYDSDGMLFSIKVIPENGEKFACSFTIASDTAISAEKAKRISSVLEEFLAI